MKPEICVRGAHHTSYVSVGKAGFASAVGSVLWGLPPRQCQRTVQSTPWDSGVEVETARDRRAPEPTIYRSAGGARGRALSDPTCLPACGHHTQEDRTAPRPVLSVPPGPPITRSHPLTFSSNHPPLLLFLVFVTNDEAEVEKVK